MSDSDRLCRILSALILGLLLLSSGRAPSSMAFGAEVEKNEAAVETAVAKKIPLATYITVTSPIDDVMFGKVKNAALELNNRAVQEQRRAILFLQITPGSSRFHQVLGLAKELSSVQLSNITTVAWVPETVTGNNVVLALACNEIVMHPDAELGDIGHGNPLDADEHQAVIALVEKRRNSKVSRALAAGLLDPEIAVYKIKLAQANGDNSMAESRVVSPDELKILRENKAAILDVETIKEAGMIGQLSGSRARALDILVVHTAVARADLADLYDVPRESLREEATSGEAPDVRLIKIDGMIEPILEAFIERQIDRSVAKGANLLIFEIDSPGGYLLSSTNLSDKIASLDPKKVRTVAYVPKMALSGAAIIALGCDEIYLHPDATIGDAGPIEMREGGQFEHAPEKVLSLLRETLKSMAEKKGRPPALAEAMADKDLVVYEVTHRENARVTYMTEDEIHKSNGEWIKGRAVPESKENNLLTVNGKRANELKLAEPPVADIGELKQRLGIPANVNLVAVGRTWVDTLVFVLNNPMMTFLLFFIGLGCIYLELFTMTGFFAIGSGVCFSLFFWSRFLGGTAGWLEVVLFVLGLVCFAIEIFVIPGFGVFGVSGGVLILLGLVLTSQTWSGFGPGPDFSQVGKTLGPLSASIVTVLILAMVMSRFLPQMKLFDRLALTPPDASSFHPDEPQLKPELAGADSPWLEENNHSLLGKRGVALSMLRPAGKAQIDDRYLDVVSDGPYIAQDSEVEVIQVTGNRIVVRQA